MFLVTNITWKGPLMSPQALYAAFSSNTTLKEEVKFYINQGLSKTAVHHVELLAVPVIIQVAVAKAGVVHDPPDQRLPVVAETGTGGHALLGQVVRTVLIYTNSFVYY